MRTEPVAAAGLWVLIAVAGCNDDDYWWPIDADTTTLDSISDGIHDPGSDFAVDPGVDPLADGVDDPGEDVSTFRSCAVGCTTAADCCSAGTDCGVYPNKWSCETICTSTGCDTDGECATWATGLGIPDGASYKCRGPVGGFASCVAGCTTAADCCPTGMDCTAYPYRYICDAGGCTMDGCISDPECVAYASMMSLDRAASYVCTTGTGGYRYCAPSCSVASDCCVAPPCTDYPANWSCPDGLCVSTCDDDGECIAWASSSSIPNASQYICHTF